MSPRGRFSALLWVLSTLLTWAVAGDKSPRDTPCAGQITYESDTDDAYRYLEAVQRQIYTQNPQLTDPYSREELNKPKSVATLEQLKARAIMACPDPSDRSQCALDPAVADQIMKAFSCLTLPTRFESPLFFKAIEVFTADVEKVRVYHFPRSSTTRFGSLPAGTFDAQAILPPGSKVPLVILNRDIFNFTGAFSMAIAYSIPITITNTIRFDSSEEDIRRRLRDHPDIVHNFADAMSRLVREGTSKGARQGYMYDDHNPLQARLLLAMNMFVISHEEAHVILGHVSDQSVAFRLAGSHNKGTSVPAQNLTAHKAQVLPPLSKSPADGPFTTLKAELRTREQELEADALGFKLMIWSWEEEGDRFGEPIAAAAPHMVFRILDAASAYGSEAGGWTFSDANHPTAADRIKALAPIFDEVARTSAPPWPADWPRVGGWRTAFDAAFKVLLEEADPQIRQNLGLQPKATP